jgi:hypothetical protein
MSHFFSRACQTLCRAATVAVGSSVLVGLVCASALAGPPFQTDDPEPTPYRHFEIYINSQFSHDAGLISGTLPSLEINYGLMRNVQFSVTAARAFSHAPGDSWQSGFGDSEIALKIRFLQETAKSPQVAFYPAIVLPSGDAQRGLGDGAAKIFLPLWGQKSFGDWTVFGGGGYWHNPGAGNRDYTFTGLAVQRDVNENFSIGAELFRVGAPTIIDTASTGFSIGMIKGLDEHHKLLFSIGRGLSGTNTLSTYAAYELYLGPKGKAAPEPPEHVPAQPHK